ncbi:hypothetical protein C8J56DRAFT_1166704 [Mycena floridula]|nr:hypothetical protein C8J56DRAFT_1166704 [Mycena floridula]
MARGPSLGLPIVDFKRIEDDILCQPYGVNDPILVAYGYNQYGKNYFKQPEHYIQYTEPLERDLARQVEYDMDEHDQAWLDEVNQERQNQKLDSITCEVFEVVMDRLEKEWFDFTKNISQCDFALPPEDSTCTICDDSEGENSNAIVFCDGCDLAVHQDCYGVPYIPESQWHCRKCTVSPQFPVSCILCPVEGGAFKQTDSGKWVHVLCAIWVPEMQVMNQIFMKCSICKLHEHLLLPIRTAGDAGDLTVFCHEHSTKDQEVHTAAAEDSLEDDDCVSKSVRTHSKIYETGPPLVPKIILERLKLYIEEVRIEKSEEFVAMVCRYWSLKREAKGGAPLLKRLHLEPWSASRTILEQSIEEIKMKTERLKLFRKDLSKLKTLTQHTSDRERIKLAQATLIHSVLRSCLFLHEPALQKAFADITAIDTHGHFRNPPSKQEVLDGCDVKTCWSTIEQKLDKHEYWDVQEFKDDIRLGVEQAILDKPAGTPRHQIAVEIKDHCSSIFEGLEALKTVHLSAPQVSRGFRETAEEENVSAGKSCQRHQLAEASDHTSADIPSVLGDLEPPLEIVELLVSSEIIQPGTGLLINPEPISSIFSYELGIPRDPENRKPTSQSARRGRGSKAGETAQTKISHMLSASVSRKRNRTGQVEVKSSDLAAPSKRPRHRISPLEEPSQAEASKGPSLDGETSHPEPPTNRKTPGASTAGTENKILAEEAPGASLSRRGKSKTVDSEPRASISSPLSNKAYDVSKRGIIASPKTDLVDGVFVWARNPPLAYFPGIIFEDAANVPTRESLEFEKQRSLCEGPLFMVKFFDKKATLGIFSSDVIRHLGKDQELDNDMLAIESQMQPWKNLTRNNNSANRKLHEEVLAAHERVLNFAGIAVPQANGGKEAGVEADAGRC